MKRRVNLIVIHCSATRENVNYTFDQCVRDHQARGFAGCGYHFFIRKDGTVHTGRPLEKIGAHVQGFNAHSVGICYEGGLDANNKPKDTRTPPQKLAILSCIQDAMTFAGKGNVKRIIGHRDLSPDKNGNGIVEPTEWVKQCPCFNAEPEYKHLVS
jgi:N-acetyl-anhydromuramyl-L-alanine amidase AmpD